MSAGAPASTPVGELRPLTRGRRPGRPARGPWKRGVAMLEFALILPMFLLMLVFTFDMGHLVLMSGATQDATFTAARTGAQLGGGGVDLPSGAIVCPNQATCTRGETYDSLADTVAQIPTMSSLGVDNSLQMRVMEGAKCTVAEDHVVVRTQMRVKLITPGLGFLMAAVSTKNDSGAGYDEWPVTATAVARCEIVRP